VYARAHGRTATRSGNAFISLRSILLCTSVNRIWRIPRVNNLPRGQNRQRACKTDESRFEKGGNRGKNLRSNPVRATRSQRREARVRPVHSRTRLAFLRKILPAMSFVGYGSFSRFCKLRIIWRSPCRPLVFVWGYVVLN